MESFQPLISLYTGDAEKFYADGLLCENLLPTKFEDLSDANILLSEVCDCMLLHLSGDPSSVSCNIDPYEKVENTVLSEKELSTMQYLSGYVLRKLYSKYKFVKSPGQFEKQYLSILFACKADPNDKQKYVDMKNRGGLWKTNADTQNIFVHAEKIFRKHTISSVTCIDSKYLVQEMLHDCHLISSFKNVRYSAELEVSKEISFNLLESMLLLFTRVGSFSYARDVREKYRNTKKQGNKSSLRTEIKKSSSSKQLRH